MCEQGKCSMQVEYINPFIQSVANVFRTMLNCELERKSLSLKDNSSPTYEVSAVIGLTGKASGAVVLGPVDGNGQRRGQGNA